MRLDPATYQEPLSAGHRAAENEAVIDGHLHLEVTRPRVKVRRGVVVIEHGDDDPVELADPRHRGTVGIATGRWVDLSLAPCAPGGPPDGEVRQDGPVTSEPANSESPPAILDNEAEQRFELVEDGHLAELVYRRRPDRMVIVHTGVPPELEGRGIGGKLVRAALDDARRRGLAVTLLCPFALEYVERHPEALEGLDVTNG